MLTEFYPPIQSARQECGQSARQECGDRFVHHADKFYRTVGWPTDRVLVSKISIGRWDRERLQQDRTHCQSASWVRRVFPCFPFLLPCFPFLLRARRAKRM